MRSDFLVSSLAVAVVVATVSLAAAECSCGGSPVRQYCPGPHYYFMEIQESANPREGLTALVDIHNAVFPEARYPGSKATPQKVWELDANWKFNVTRVKVDCACPGDRVCFLQPKPKQ